MATVNAAGFYKPRNLLSIDSNPKTVKGQKIGFMTGVLYLAPHTLSGINVCPMAEIAGCVKPCLNTAGNPAYADGKRKGRLNKTIYFHRARDAFMGQLVQNIRGLIRKAKRAGFIPLVRLNGTSDIRWENIGLTVDGIEYPNIFAVFPDLQFYDYSKIANRKDIPSNYDLTFSYSGLPEYQPFVLQAIQRGYRIAVVFRRQADIPARFMGLPVVDGDNSDVRHLDPAGVVVALYAKGPAITDYSGFVVDPEEHARKPLARAHSRPAAGQRVIRLTVA